MRILLDECIDRRLAAEPHGHVVKTVPEAGWAGLKDGQLLSFAQHDFDVLLTVDRNLPHQQHLASFDIAVVILQAPTNRLADLRLLMPLLLVMLPATSKGQATFIGS